MKNTNTVYEFKNYGKIHIRLKEILESQNMSRNELAVSVGTNFDVINRWYNDTTSRVDLDVLARVCFVLGCEPQDLIVYTMD